MTRQFMRGLIAGTVALTLLGIAAPVYAQNGSLRGRVVDEAGKPVADVEVTFDFVGDYQRQLKSTTNKDGEWVRTGLLVTGGGRWKISAKKDDLMGELPVVFVRLNEMTKVDDLVLLSPASAAATAKKSAAGLSAEEVAKRNKRAAELEALFNEANTAMDAGNLDEAIAKLTTLATEMETGEAKCPACFAKLGEVYFKKNDLPAAEAALLKSIERDPAQPGPYNALATIYNQQRKFEDATKMSQKAAELMGASGGGADAPTVFNQGVIFWNQSKIPEAKAQFEKAIQLDPTMADAHYWFGMALVNEGKLPEAKKPFEEYLKLAPTGQYADTAKAILATIK